VLPPEQIKLGSCITSCDVMLVRLFDDMEDERKMPLRLFLMRATKSVLPVQLLVSRGQLLWIGNWIEALELPILEYHVDEVVANYDRKSCRG